jgi:pilus assembly protein CpaC
MSPSAGATSAAAPGGASGAVTGSRAISRVINALKILAPQQVMLEVKIAEVSKTLLEQLGLTLQGSKPVIRNGQEVGDVIKWGIMSDVLGGNAAIAGLLFNKGRNMIDLDAQKKDGLVKILAEPTIVAMSGQQGSFLAGGRLLIPVSQPSANGNTIQLAEREVGIGLKFLPTVLDNGRINLMVAPEVSEVAKEGVSLAAASGPTSLLPFITTRRVSTTVQLRDGQSLIIGGLMKNNVSQTVRALPLLGELPILGPLFRSSQFAADKTELVVAVSVTIVKPVDEVPALPTDKFITPSRGEFLFKGKMEGNAGGAK